MLRPSIPAGIRLKVETQPDIEEIGKIRADAGELSQMLVNLILNARDAVGDNGDIRLLIHHVEVSTQICMACQQPFAGVFVAIDVIDNGSGIGSEHLPHLFEPFFTTKEMGKGTGLGLSMVQGMLQRCAGHVHVDSLLGHGTCFRLLFVPEDTPQTHASLVEASTPTQPQSLRAQSEMLWVVDDDNSVSGYLDELLTDEGFRVERFQDPLLLLEALRSLRRDDVRPVALISDLHMPGMSGLALARVVRSDWPDLPVFLCTGNAENLDPGVLQVAGVRQAFCKPFDSAELLAALSRVLPP